MSLRFSGGITGPGRRSVVAFVTGLIALAAGCAINPVTGARQLTLISEQQEIQMGREYAAEVQQTMRLVDDPELQAYVSRLGRQLAAASERPNLPWSFSVVDDPTPNAFALPGGFVFVTRGLMALMGTEAQLVTVLGHEIGHVTARHHVSQMTRSQLAQLGLGIGSVLMPNMESLTSLAGAGVQLALLSNSRDAERQADELGFRYALENGFDVREMALVFESLQRVSQSAGGSAVPAWLMTHPDPGDRIVTVERRVAATRLPPSPRIGAQAYLDQIDGLVYGVNPRDGFMENGVFLHPDLKFRVPFPSGWQVQNLSEAVIAANSQQNAVLQVTIAAEKTIDAASQSFLGQTGIQSGTVERSTVNGLSTVQATFTAQSESSGTLQGQVAFISHGGAVYQVLGYATQAAYAGNQAALRSTVRGFAPLTDSRALNVQPAVLRIVRTTAATTLEQFQQRNPSTISLGELAILNQLASGSAVVPAGTMLKRVTN
ncbi:MAG: M48 family metalloprotease [Gemmatimonadota bacterium]|jgi:predicted Zn-dependent protease|nr:M48 family metalloprotease [Gemmatimonadota bacterium]